MEAEVCCRKIGLWYPNVFLVLGVGPWYPELFEDYLILLFENPGAQSPGDKGRLGGPKSEAGGSKVRKGLWIT